MSNLLIRAEECPDSIPVHKVNFENLDQFLKTLPPAAGQWVRSNNYKAKSSSIFPIPDKDGNIICILFGEPDKHTRLGAGTLAKELPEGTYHLGEGFDNKFQDTLAFALGGYRFDAYKRSEPKQEAKLVVESSVDLQEIQSIAHSVGIVRDLINTPAIDFGPLELAEQAQKLFELHGGQTKTISGEDLITENFPMIYAVGGASERKPMLIDLSWGQKDKPKITLVGKGVCYDTGGLNLKPGNSMLLMKKDMGGAANVLGLSSMIMSKKLPIQLRVLIPAVENVVSARSFRPGDVVKSRKGITVEIGNTDAEGRLILADALALADEEKPELLIDIATLTGAARVALGPELPPFYTDDEKLAEKITHHAQKTEDPVWRMPLWQPYLKMLETDIADINNVSKGAFAGSIQAALFLSKFVENTESWVHFDIFGWIPSAKPYGPVGGEAQSIRALYDLICEQYADL